MTLQSAASTTQLPLSSNLVNIDPNYSTSLEDLVDKVFYGVRMNTLTGKASIDKIAGDAPISLPDSYVVRPDDYKSWLWTYNTFQFSWDIETGHLLMEVL
jgi:hypothetical protein